MSPVLGPSYSLSTCTLVCTGAELWITLRHLDDACVTSIHLYKSQAFNGCPPLHHLEFTFCHLTSAVWSTTALSADVSLPPPLNQGSVGADAERAAPEGHQCYAWANELVRGQNVSLAHKILCFSNRNPNSIGCIIISGNLNNLLSDVAYGHVQTWMVSFAWGKHFRLWVWFWF